MLRQHGVTRRRPTLLYDLIHPAVEDAPQEEVHVIALNSRNRVISRRMIYRGNVNSSTVRPAEILRCAVVTGAPSIAMLHNHPSGDPTPSCTDVSITKDVRKAAELMGITLLDHVVTGEGRRYVSMKNAKLMEE